MSKALTIFFILMTSLLLNNNTTADIYSDLNRCSDIQRSLKRLECFDLVSKKYQPSGNTEVTSNQNSKNISNQDLRKDNTLTQQSITQKQLPVETQSNKSSYGLTDKNLEDNSVESNIVGQFSGWEKDMKLNLKNGQVWKVLKSVRGYKKLTNPKITITNGILGSFNAKVEGLNSVAKVKRIK